MLLSMQRHAEPASRTIRALLNNSNLILTALSGVLETGGLPESAIQPVAGHHGGLL